MKWLLVIAYVVKSTKPHVRHCSFCGLAFVHPYIWLHPLHWVELGVSESRMASVAHLVLYHGSLAFILYATHAAIQSSNKNCSRNISKNSPDVIYTNYVFCTRLLIGRAVQPEFPISVGEIVKIMVILTVFHGCALLKPESMCCRASRMGRRGTYQKNKYL